MFVRAGAQRSVVSEYMKVQKLNRNWLRVFLTQYSKYETAFLKINLKY